ncbi:MAG: hypothetical protein KJZ87_24210 [Thermoguttaceae bacterium]|nr:hypothetical protein [Thermoguttaceae bacterium]
MEFDPARYGNALRPLLDIDRCRELGPGHALEAARAALEAMSIETAFAARRVADRQMAELCLGAVWLLHDFLDQSHRVSQAVDTPTGSYWHGIMHRREPDYGNAKYWFRRVGQHPIHAELHRAARELAGQSPDDAAAALLAQTSWDALGFVDLCQEAAGGRSLAEALCRGIQQREWELLFDFCYQRAVGQ